jgi:SAM-dependent methyltransferase
VATTRLRELSFSRASGERVLRMVAPFVSPGQRHLDYGAGDGDFTRLLVARGLATAVLEPSQERRALLENSDIGRSPHFLGVMSPGFADTFDVVFMLDVIEHILEPDLDAALTSVARAVTLGGTLVVTTPNTEDLDLNACICPNCNSTFHRWQHQRSFSADSLAALLAKYGFARVHDHRVDLTNTAGYIERIKQLESEHPLARVGYTVARRILAKLRPPPPEEQLPPGDLRIGGEAHLIYVGRRIR